MKNLFIGAALIGMLILSGCTTLSPSQCITSDWKTVGYRDGISGTQSSQLLKHQNACVKHGIVPNRQAYLGGWDEGVKQYCQPHNGFIAGERGVKYANVCPTHMKADFYAAYKEGQQIYLVRSELSNLQQSISQKEYRLNEIKNQIAQTEAHLVNNSTGTSERRHLLEQTKSLAQEQGKLETEVQILRVEVAVKAERLENLRQVLALAAYEMASLIQDTH